MDLSAEGLAGAVDSVRDLIGPKCRAALLAEILALCHGLDTRTLEGLKDELRTLVGMSSGPRSPAS